MKAERDIATASFPFLSILCLIFITLKLTGHITWSWWLVLAPLWVPLMVVVVMAAAVIMLIVAFRYIKWRTIK